MRLEKSCKAVYRSFLERMDGHAIQSPLPWRLSWKPFWIESLENQSWSKGIWLRRGEQHFTPWNIAWICSTNACLGNSNMLAWKDFMSCQLHYMSNSCVNYGCYRRRFCARIKKGAANQKAFNTSLSTSFPKQIPTPSRFKFILLINNGIDWKDDDACFFWAENFGRSLEGQGGPTRGNRVFNTNN